jgi:DNA-binding XRE family transcriptional regulator
MQREKVSAMQVQRGQSQEEIIRALRQQIDELTAANQRLQEQLAARKQDSASNSNLPHLNAVQWIRAASGLSQERIGRLIGVTRQTINRWENGEPITDTNRRRLFAVRDVLERATLQHSTPAELAAWLDTPDAVDGRTPAELLEMGEINKARLFAISAPSPGLTTSPEWVGRSIPEAFLAGAEHRQEALRLEKDDEPGTPAFDEEDEWEELPNT